MRVQHIDPIELPKNKSSKNYQDGENFSDDALQRRISGGYPEKMKWFKISKYFYPDRVYSSFLFKYPLLQRYIIIITK